MRLSYQPLTRRWRLQVSSARSATPAWCWARCSTAARRRWPRCSASRAGASPTPPRSTGRHPHGRIPLPPGRVAAAAAVPDRRRRPEPSGTSASRATSAWRWRAPVNLPRSPEGPPRKLLQARAPGAGRWPWRITVVVAIGIVLMFLLTQATNNRELYERNYGRLFALNMVVAGVLLAGDPVGRSCACCAAAARQVRQPPAGEAGGHLRAGGLVPGVLIYVVSYQFVSRSIESWFDVKVEGALDAGLNLGAPRSTRWPTTSATRPAQPPRSWPNAGHLRRPGAGAHARPARGQWTWCCGAAAAR
jgi:hypothetical protein